jgi:tetratricopeptide (TPR) repeat protein
VNAERYRALKALVFEAGDLPARERESFLERQCESDAELLAEALALVRADIPTESVLDPLRQRTEASSERLPPRVGRYRLGAELGRGGMGVVHEATDERTGEEVAIKILHAHVADGEDFAERFMREARIGSSIVHGGVVRTLDAGTDRGAGRVLHFLVMERVRGRTLRQLLADLGAVPEGLVREIGRQCAAALAAVHAAGIVHRDVKPDNILITPEERVRLMDLGIAKVLDSTARLTREGQFLGSLTHAAPEQIEGREIGPAADLYALGVTLLELATGANPFLRDGAAATIRAQLEHVPRAPRDVSPFLSRLLSTLLEKVPARRFASAADLHAALLEGEDGSWWRDVSAGVAESGLPHGGRGSSARLVGRDAEMEVLLSAWEDALAGRGGAVVIEGDTGLGKTRLAAEIADLAASSGATVVRAEITRGEGVAAFVPGLARALGEAPEREIARQLGDAPALRDALLAMIRMSAPPEGALEGALGLAAAHWLRAAAGERPVLVILDDAHHAAEAASLARALARAAVDRAALVIATVRLGVQLPGLAPGARRIRLERLDSRTMTALVESLLVSRACATQLGPRLALRSDGVPGFAIDTIRTLQQRGALKRDERDGEWQLHVDPDKLELPAAAHESITERLRDLPRELREVLDVAAIQGLDFDADVVAAVLDRPLVRVLQDLAEIERRHALARSTGRRHALDGRLLVEILRAEIPEGLARLHETRMAEALEQRAPAGPPSGRMAAEVAEHHLRGSRPEAAATVAAVALEQLTRDNRFALVLELADITLGSDAPLSPADRVRVMLARARALGVLGRSEVEGEAVRLAREAADRLGDASLLSGSWLVAGGHAWHLARLGEAVSCFERAIELARAAGDEWAELQAVRGLAAALQAMGRDGEALRWHEWSRERAHVLGDALTEAAVVLNVGGLRIAQRKYALALDTYREAAELARRCGDVRVLAHAEGGVGLASLMHGQREVAVEHLFRQVMLSQEVGDRRSESLALGNAGLAALELGRLGESLSLLSRAIQLGEEVRDRSHRVVALSNVGLVRLALGDVAKARAAEGTALDLAREVGLPILVARCMLRLGLAFEIEGDSERALAHAREAEDLARATGDTEVQCGALLVQSRLDADRGAREDAVRAADLALDLASTQDGPSLALLAMLQRATLPGADPAAAAERLDREEGCLAMLDRLRAYRDAWRATRSSEYLARARQILDALSSHAPAAQRREMVDLVPLHREIAQARHERS